MITVVIATYNRPESLTRCLDALNNQTYKNFELVIERGGKSLAEARQLGFEKAKGEIVVYIDDDVEVTKDWLKEVVETFKDKKVGGVSGPTIVSKDEMRNRDVFKLNRGFAGWIYKKIILEGREKEAGKICKSGMWTPGSNFESARKLKGPVTVDYLEACNMALRRDLIKKAGGFDLGFKGTSEWCEVDLAMRIKKMGHRLVFNPKAIVYHHVSREGVFNNRVNSKERMENFLRYFAKHGKMNWRFFACVAFWNGYWIYKAITTRNVRWLGGLTVVKISSNLKLDD